MTASKVISGAIFKAMANQLKAGHFSFFVIDAAAANIPARLAITNIAAPINMVGLIHAQEPFFEV